MRSLLFLSVVGGCGLYGAEDPTSVLLIVNDSTPAELGTAGKGASQFVAEYYAQVRGIPLSQIVHINTPMACCKYSPAAWDSWHISFADFKTKIRQPVKAFIDQNKLGTKIKYIVPVYGVPSHINEVNGYLSVSVDGYLASMYSPRADVLYSPNPYFADNAKNNPQHLKSFNAGWPYFSVVRLDGPTAIIAAGLVDKAVLAEKRIRKDSGIGYFDFQGHGKGPDASMKKGYDFCVAKGLACALNDQSKTGAMLQRAPNALWAWGWYSSTHTNQGYSFANGAVGAQLTSYTAGSIRSEKAGAWVPIWLSAGITATWGATGEPTSSGYAYGDVLLNYLWNGYNFGEAAALSNPALNWMMVFIGDPLYSPDINDPHLPANAQKFDDVPVTHPYFASINSFKEFRVTKGCSEKPALYCPDWSTSRGQMAVFIIRALMGGDNFTYDPKPYFVDVPASSEYFKYVQKMKELKITRGCWLEPAYYCPNDPVPHGSMAVFLMRAQAGYTFEHTKSPFFSDVAENSEMFPYVQRMRDLGISFGCAAGKFCPDTPISRAEMADWMVKTFYR